MAVKTQDGQTVCATFDRCDTDPHLPTCARLARVPIERRWITPLGPLLAGGERPVRPPPPGGVSVSGVGGAAAARRGRVLAAGASGLRADRRTRKELHPGRRWLRPSRHVAIFSTFRPPRLRR